MILNFSLLAKYMSNFQSENCVVTDPRVLKKKVLKNNI